MTAGGQPSQLFPGPVGTRAAQFGMDLHDAPGAQVGFQLHWDTPGIHPGRAAFLLVREIYGWFEIDEDGIPYTSVEGGERVIDPEVIRRNHP